MNEQEMYEMTERGLRESAEKELKNLFMQVYIACIQSGLAPSTAQREAAGVVRNADKLDDTIEEAVKEGMKRQAAE